MVINQDEIINIEKLLLPKGCSFNDEAKDVISCMESKEILACPGSGKTTVLLAKIKLLSDRMPFKDGKGVCILSHTNVAVNEIKNKLGEDANKILDYPNFVGTIQSFIDRYVVFPYLCGKTSLSVQVTDDESFAEAFWRKCHLRKYSKIRYLIENGCKIHPQFSSPVDFIKKLYLYEGDLYVQGVNTKKAGKDKAPVKEYNDLINNLLVNDGLIRYKDAYSYTEDALATYGSALRSLLSQRFKFVFIDEYQDCTVQQRGVIDKLFDKSKVIIQKIGDVDQAIYNSDADEDSKWLVSSDALSLPGTNRYGQEIADVLVLLRTNNEPIMAFKGNAGIKPTLIVFNDDTRENVVDKFIEEIKNNNLQQEFPEGPFKAIGMYKNVTGLKIRDYWKGYQNKSEESTYTFAHYVQKISIELKNGNLYRAESLIRKLLCHICYYSGKTGSEVNKDGSKKALSLFSIKKELDECEEFDYREKILALTRINSFDYLAVRNCVVDIIKNFVDKDKINMPRDFWNDSDRGNDLNKRINTYEGQSGVKVDFDTVYKVKGETHIATLYLETEKSRGTDIKRILPLLEGKQLKEQKDLYEKSRRCIYVGFSRPSHLLCLAIHESTYKKQKKAFEHWKVISLS